MKRKLTDIIFSFPSQLLALHLRSNLLLVFTWAVLALFLTGNLGVKFGMNFLFLAPEYLGKVGFWSFFYVGVGFGALLMSWNLTTYLLSAYRFSFLACLNRPFTKFCFNNFLLPGGFLLLYLVCQIRFGLYYELQALGTVLWHSLGFLTGILTFVGALACYFYFTNKDILSLLKGGNNGGLVDGSIAPGQEDLPVIRDIKLNRNQWRVDTYLTETFRPRLVRSVAHYPAALLLRVFRQNHLNALMVQLFTLVVLVVLGAMMDRPAYRIPTGASIFLLASIVTAVAGAISYWFNRWTLTAILALMFLVNLLTRFDFFHHKNKAYGLNYAAPPAVYEADSLTALSVKTSIEADKAATIQILENWKRQTGEAKPKMIFFCVSGGGLKSTAWTMQVLQEANRQTGGKFLKHVALISGASGGLLGAAYFRELNLRQKQGEPIDPLAPKHISDISKDLLNPISFTIITNDLFLPWATFEHGGHRYKKDRGYIFEKTLNENTDRRLDKSLGDYAQPEREALVPMLFVTPSIVNDGRRMVISSQPVSYMMVEPIAVEVPNSVEVDAVDFGRLFARQGAQNLRFTTALRMNATYPYILPNVYLPSDPPIEVLDAGFRDNFGLKTATRFMHVFKDWIRENTGGVVLVTVRAFERERKIEASENSGVFESLFNPLGIAFKIMSLQDFEHDNNLGFVFDMLGKENFEIVRFTYVPSEQMKESPISFYLTERERTDVLKAIESKESATSLERLRRMLKEE